VSDENGESDDKRSVASDRSFVLQARLDALRLLSDVVIARSRALRMRSLLARHRLHGAG
jgi:hypothetical protein